MTIQTKCIVCLGKRYRKNRCRKCYKIYRQKLFHCTFKTCVKPVFAATLCQYHYRYWQTNCLLCDKNVYCRSLCRNHYRIARIDGIFPEEPKCIKCDNTVYVHGMCLNHFKEKYKQNCLMIGCNSPSHKRGLCCKHYFRDRRS